VSISAEISFKRAVKRAAVAVAARRWWVAVCSFWALLRGFDGKLWVLGAFFDRKRWKFDGK
jgi:hypothetical protein